MTITKLDAPLLLPAPYTANVSLIGASTVFLDAADEGYAAVWNQEESKTLSAATVAVGTVTTGSTMELRIETVDPATGFPSGSLVAAGASATQVVNAADDNVVFTISLTTPVALTAGTDYAIVFKQPTASSGNLQFECASTFMDPGVGKPYGLQNTGVSPSVSWSKKSSEAPSFALTYNDGTICVPRGVFPVHGSGITLTLNTGTTPDVAGMLFTPAFSFRVIGAWAGASIGGDANFRLVSTAYHQVNATGILATGAVDKDIRGNTGATILRSYFTSPYTVIAGTSYRLILEPSTATSVSLYATGVLSSDIAKAWLGIPNCLTTAKDPTANGSWTDYSAASPGYRIPCMGLIIDAIDLSSGGGQRAYAA
jgi:hypothetical protein